MQPRSIGPSGRVAIIAALVLALLAATAAGAAALSQDYPPLRVGDRGANVRALQGLLRAHGADIAVDGRFGSNLTGWIRLVQRRAGLTHTGRLDARTWMALAIIVRPDDSGEAVKALQRLLNEKRRSGLTVNGTLDGATRDAVVTFQRHVGMTTSGSVGPAMWRKLLAHLELPAFGSRLCDYSVGNGPANWGTAEAIGALEAAAAVVVDAGHGRVPVGDLSHEHGGDIAGHQTHEQGLDVDLRPMRVGKDQCTWGTNYRLGSYDRAATRDLVQAIRETAPGRVKLIYFNDPVLIREGLTIAYPGHADHLHVRYCQIGHALAAYRC